MNLSNYREYKIEDALGTATIFLLPEEWERLDRLSPRAFIHAVGAGARQPLSAGAWRDYVRAYARSVFRQAIKRYFWSIRDAYNRNYILRCARHYNEVLARIDDGGIDLSDSVSIETLIIRWHAALRRTVPEQPHENVTIVRPRLETERLSVREWRYGSIAFIAHELGFGFLGGHVEESLVHGSFATEDFVPGWSDLDLLVFLRESALSSERVLRRVRDRLHALSLLCHKIDPDAHHTFDVLCPTEWEDYTDAILPPVVLHRAVALLGRGSVSLSYRKSPGAALLQMFGYIQSMRTQTRHGRVVASYFECKRTVASILNFPVLYRQAVGEYRYKGDTFEDIRDVFSDAQVAVIEDAERSRQVWSAPDSFLRFVPDAVIVSGGAVIERLLRRYLHMRRRLSPGGRLEDVTIPALRAFDDMPGVLAAEVRLS